MAAYAPWIWSRVYGVDVLIVYDMDFHFKGEEEKGNAGNREEWKICKPHALLGRFIEVVNG